jgi:two-component system response regulator VicR
MKILVVEDEPLIRKMMELKLNKEGYEIIASEDGKDALLKIDSEKPDMIITDIMMPYVSGLEIVGKVREDKTRNVPIIVVSTMGQEATVEEAFKLGADDYLTKPFSLVELSMRIKRLARA